MPEHYEPDSGSKSKTYQSIAVYDGSDPAYFKNWHAKVLSHYATWLNGEDRAGHWKQGICSGESSVQFELGEVCHAKSQFGLATQMGVCACYTTRSLTGHR